MSSALCTHALPRIVRDASLVVLALIGLATGAHAQGDIVVVAAHGTATVTMAGSTSPLAADLILQLPATIRTASDGAVELRQGKTTVAAAGDTELEIPASAGSEGLIERIVQIRGNAFYSVDKRERTRLRVETPYLVAVIKGTQFNVAAQRSGTTIALFEGRLEVRASDDSDVIDLNAGEIAIRNVNDTAIRVLRMSAPVASTGSTDGTVVGSGDASSASGAIGQSTSISTGHSAPTGVANAGAVDEAHNGIAAGVDASMTGTGTQIGGGDSATTLAADTTMEIASGLDAASAPDAGGGGLASVSLGAASGIDLSSGAVDVGAVSSVALGDIGIGSALDAGIDVGSGSAAVGIAATADLGGTDISVGTDAAIDLGNSASIDADLNLNAPALGDSSVAASTTVSLDSGGLGAAAGADISTGPADLGASLGASVGSASGVDLAVSVDDVAAVDAGLDLTGGAASAAVGVETPVAGVDAAVDLGAGEVSAGVDLGVAGVDVDLGSGTIDLNLGGNDTGGGLLNGLLRRRGRD